MSSLATTSLLSSPRPGRLVKGSMNLWVPSIGVHASAGPDQAGGDQNVSVTSDSARCPKSPALSIRKSTPHTDSACALGD
jgi:hypothetical protein